jgi:pimeloyl-ACP methyl ester carboxylesterase
VVALKIQTLVQDLLNVLPKTTPPSWTNVKTIDPKKPTIILVSGFMASNRALSVIRKRLLKDGFNVIIMAMDWNELSDAVDGLYYIAEKLSKTILTLHKEMGMGKNRIYLVAHSAGGLVARYYIQFFGGSHYCRALITMATPHQGTWYSLLGFFTHLILKARILYQMLPISSFIANLNQAPYPADFKMVSIFSRHDIMCSTKSTRLPDHMCQEREIHQEQVDHLSHTDFLLSKEVYSLILKHIKIKEENFQKITA